MTVADRLRDNTLPYDNAAQLGRLLGEVGDLLSAEERALWVKAAETVPPRRSARLVRRRIEEAAQKTRTAFLGLNVTERARNRFRPAGDIA